MIKRHLKTAAAATLLIAAVCLIVPASGQRRDTTPAKQLGGTTAAAPFSPNLSNDYRSASGAHKLSVQDPELVAQLQAQGARVIADYGSYTLMTTNAAGAEAAKAAGAAVVDHHNVIMLNAGAIDTTAAQPEALTATGKGGKQMRLIQFAGPIKPEWYAALEATGVRIVTYIPSNSYLIYGTDETLQNASRLAADRSIVQWEGNFTAAHRIDPSVSARPGTKENEGAPAPANLSASGNEQFTIQLVEDAEENAVTLELIEKLKLEPILSKENALDYVNVNVAMSRDAVMQQIAQRPDVVSIHQWITPVKMDERQNTIIAGNVSGSPLVPAPGNYLNYLTSKGFSLTAVSDFVVNVSDAAIGDVHHEVGDRGEREAFARQVVQVITRRRTTSDFTGRRRRHSAAAWFTRASRGRRTPAARSKAATATATSMRTSSVDMCRAAPSTASTSALLHTRTRPASAGVLALRLS
jgi:hypothetical protein